MTISEQIPEAARGCGCKDKKGCFHDPCTFVRQLSQGQLLIRNYWGHIGLADIDDVGNKLVTFTNQRPRSRG